MQIISITKRKHYGGRLAEGEIQYLMAMEVLFDDQQTTTSKT